jgi:hypothetical protein
MPFSEDAELIVDVSTDRVAHRADVSQSVLIERDETGAQMGKPVRAWVAFEQFEKWRVSILWFATGACRSKTCWLKRMTCSVGWNPA